MIVEPSRPPAGSAWTWRIGFLAGDPGDLPGNFSPELRARAADPASAAVALPRMRPEGARLAIRQPARRPSTQRVPRRGPGGSDEPTPPRVLTGPERLDPGERTLEISGKVWALC